jgi:alpha-beta hydrolase superfamily lysophospholipase
MWKKIGAALAVVFSTGCSSLFYYPTRVKYVDDRRLTHRPEEVHFKSAGGADLVGWYFSAVKQPPEGVIVFFHGNGQNLSAHFASLYWILDEGYDFFIFDYPGYGISPGGPTPENTVRAGAAAVRFARGRHPDLPLAVYGQSLGGAVAMKTVEDMNGDPPVCALVLDSTFKTYRGVARDVLASTFWTWIFQPLTYLVLSDRWSPAYGMEKLSLPALVIHATHDPLVPFARGKDVFDSLPGPTKEFYPVESHEHAANLVGKEGAGARAKMLAFLNRYCGG